MEAYKNLDLEDMSNEQWSEFHIGKLKKLLVSDFGRVKSIDKKTGKTLIRKQKIDTKGRPYIHINDKAVHISRLVALMFISNQNNYPCVLHGDNNPKNNHISNLRWGTHSENIKQAHKDGLMKSTSVVVLTREGKLLGKFNSILNARLFLNSKDTTGFDKAKSIKNYVVMKKNYHDELNHEQLQYVCQNVNSRGVII